MNSEPGLVSMSIPRCLGVVLIQMKTLLDASDCMLEIGRDCRLDTDLA